VKTSRRRLPNAIAKPLVLIQTPLSVDVQFLQLSVTQEDEMTI
jgi:hypothetical protein